MSIDNNSKKIDLNYIDFNLPIFYIQDKYTLNDNVKNDLEISNTYDHLLYRKLFSNTHLDNNIFYKDLLDKYSTYYTNNSFFLNDMKYFIKNYTDSTNEYDINNIQNVYKDINEINSITDKDKNFVNTYQYLEIFPIFEFLNRNSLFLQCLSLYNIFNPLITIVIPIILLFIPFFIILLKGHYITIANYVEILLTIMKNHPLGNAIKDFTNVGWDRKFFLTFSLVFYFFNIYQNIISCIKFYKNFNKINNYLHTFKNFCKYYIQLIDNVNSYCKSSLQGFIDKNNEIKNYLTLFYNNLTGIKFSNFNIFELHTMGHKMKYFYELFKSQEYISSIKYCLYLHSFKDSILCIQKNINDKKINLCKIVNNKETKIYNSYYCCIDSNYIANNIDLKNNIIITGPNASGKTTILKSTLFNIILSQQFCCGFYKKAEINPYNYIHSYINIPDTSQRDSLFQSEVRRCKYILDSIESNEGRHFCIFDELYSGTNPTEAISCAYSYLKYLTNYKKCNFMLTTHFTTLCEKLNSHKNIINNKMNIIDNKFTYKLSNGISYYKGGINVLKELNYPDNVIKDAENIIQKINI